MKRRVVLLSMILSLLFTTQVFAGNTTTKFSQIAWGKIDNLVCLTFDDGWSKSAIKSILSTLEKNKIKCTFFIVGCQLKAYPELWQQAIKNGHEICCHTMNHANLTKLTNDQIKKDIENWNKTAQKTLGKDYSIPKFIRCPGGNANQRVLKFLIDELGYSVVYWSDDTYSTVIKYHPKDPVSQVSSLIASHIIKNTKSKSIILFHFNSYDSGALPKIIENLKNKFNFGTLTEALAVKEKT